MMVTGRDFDPFVRLAVAANWRWPLCERQENTGPRYNFNLKKSRSFLNRFLLGLRHFRGFGAAFSASIMHEVRI